MPTIPESELPSPRLELRWEAANVERVSREYNSVCRYNFVFPLGELDIRSEIEVDGRPSRGKIKNKVVELNATLSRSSVESSYSPEIDDVRIPYRDGAHIQWDAPHFGKPPMYAVACGRAMLITPHPEAKAIQHKGKLNE